jgi:GNAT superfamily N-acetyltransferase
MTTSHAPELTTRRFVDGDLDAVMELLSVSMGAGPAGDRTREFFRWKHLDNPFGRSLMLLAEHDGTLVGLRAFMRWSWNGPDGAIPAVRAVDTATHPSYRRMGIFSRLTGSALELLRDEGTALVFNTPNEKSLPGYLKMGWVKVGRVPVHLRVRRPARFVAGLAGRAGRSDPSSEAPEAHTVLHAQRASLPALLAAAGASRDHLATPREPSYLQWRYGQASGLGYRAVTLPNDGGLRGLAIFRVRDRKNLTEATVAELIAAPGDGQGQRALLRLVARAARVDHLATHFSSTIGQRPPLGWVRAPGGVTLVVNKLREVSPSPDLASSWALSLGDIEVF